MALWLKNAHTLQQAAGAVAVLIATTLAADSFAAGRKHSKDQSGKVRIQNIRSSSEETTAERERRLYRECQGRPNSGACSGYAQKPQGGKR
ncbi:MAG: hypothetical protein LBE30_14540 [Comamonas sp.]|jgi:hypothetical protein|nr:hypothetical protein [Comamonas sp.]